VLGKDINVYYPIERQAGRAIEEAVVIKLEEVVNKNNDRYSSSEPRVG